MRTFTFITSILTILLIGSLGLSVKAQTGVLNPDDPIVVYDPAHPPATPAYGTLAKWVKTNRLGFNTESFKAYYYKGMAFRLKFPKSYKDSINTNKTYPVFIFFHGIGEKGTIYDNEYQLYHGGQLFRDAVDNGKFDGFLLYPQTTSSSGGFNSSQYAAINELITNYLVPQAKADINRVIVDGLSGGGSSSWHMLNEYTKLVAAALPISAASVTFGDAGKVNAQKFTPIWLFQGGLDVAPTPYTSKQIVNKFKEAGGNITYTEYPNQGHGCWYSAWGEPDFFPFIRRAHKANPWPLTGRTEFCPADPISVTMGVTAGFDGYEWRKDGVLITGASSNTYTATTVGKYDCRIKRGSVWSVWSPVPVEIKHKGATISPDIVIDGVFSNVIPSPAGNASVVLKVPEGYTSYNWQKEGSGMVLSSTNTLTVSAAGKYKVRVTEEYGCSSEFSNLFEVIDAGGPNPPPAPMNIGATVLSKTAIKLNWVQNGAPAFNETGFEIYRSGDIAGPYELLTVTAPDVITYTSTDLNPNSQYYYKIRAVNSTGASAATNPIGAMTQADNSAPSAPGNLRTASSTRNSVSLIWDESTDDVGVVKYDVYVNGVKYYETDQPQFTVFNLTHGQTYAFRVKARDFAGNVSSFSNQATAQALLNGLYYKYYTFTGTWNNLPDFNTLEPEATGLVPNITLENRTQSDNFAYLWEGFITIPTTGSYTFRTNSDDGSKLYLSPYSFGAAALVNNDGLHGGQNVDGTITLDAGTYPIAITYYEQGGGESMTVSWKTPGSANFVPIPNSVFADAPVVDGEAPAAPDGMVATALSTSSVSLTWNDNSDDEEGFEIWRSSGTSSGFSIIATVPANATSYTDEGLEASTQYFYRLNAINQYGETSASGGGDNGINYSYYEQNGLNALPDFNALTPKKTGVNGTVGLGMQDRGDNFQLKFSGYIKIPTSGTYTFYTSSDDGSNLYINGFDAAHKVVDNDGAHGTAEKSGPITLDAGIYPIYVTFFEAGGGEVLTASIAGPGLSKQTIPASMLVLDPGVNATTLALPPIPFAPEELVASGISDSSVEIGWNYHSTVTVTNTIPASNTRIEAENYSAMQGVQKENCSEGGQDVGYIDANDWMDYSFNAPATATYTVNFRVASPQTNSNQLQLRSADGTVLTTVTVPNTGNWQGWTTVSGTATLTAGPQTIRVFSTVGGFNFNWFELISPESQVSVTDTAYASSFELYRSANDDQSYALLATLPASILSFTDISLQENAVYYYKVRALNEGGTSLYSNEDSAVTKNNSPVLAAIADEVMRYGAQLQVNVSAEDGGSGALTISFENLPSFGSYESTGNGTGVLTFNPVLADVGTYNDIKVIVTDQFGSADTVSFNLVVNANYIPEVSSVSNITLDELGSGQISISATDQNTEDSLIWTFKGLPSFATPAINDREVEISLAPGYADNGTYNVVARVEDGNEGVDSVTFVITVNDVNPNKTVYMNFGDATYTAAAPWNNTAKSPVANDNFANLKDENGVTTGISIRLLTAWSGINNVGANTGNNSGIFPDAVLRSSYYTNTTRTVRISGLSASYKYNLTLLGSRANPTVGVVTNYTVGGQTLSLNASNNSQNTVTFSNIQAEADGTITFAVANASGSMYGYLNGLVISSIYDDGSAPATPRDLTAVNDDVTGKVQLSWTDAAYNETAYEVYKATSLTGPYTLLNPGGNNANLNQLEDGAVSGNSTYYYTVRTLNAYGNSVNSDTVSITTSNVNPLLQAIADITMATQQTVNVNVSATDPGDVITLSASNLPVFATFTDNGNGSGTIEINSGNYAGVYNDIVVTATDNHGGSSSESFNLTVNVANLTRVLVNFNQTNAVGLPWNSTNNAPSANFTLSNLKDETSSSTGMNLTLLDAWTANSTLGVVTGNNGGIYPDDVMRTFYYYSGTSARRVRISGLSQTKKYDFVFFASRANYASALTSRYTIGTEYVELNATNNSTQTVKIEGVSPDSNGEIIISVTKVNGSPNAYLGAMVIDAYDNVIENPVPPSNLKAAGTAKDEIRLNWGKTVGATGYEVWRASSASGTYSKISDVAAGITTYTNTGLAAATVYYYKVRAIANGEPTAFSNYAGASTVAYTVNLNLNDGTANAPAQPGNWNNTNALVSNGFVLPNLINDQGLNTGISFEVVTNFSGFNYLGATTGNNSGVYPDNVMKNFYYLNYADTARLKITGLTLAHTYNFVFFGSRINPVVGVTTAYKIGSQIVTLDATNNTANTVKISGVKPEADGSVSITLYGTLSGGFGYLNAMSIEGAPGVAPDPSLPVELNSTELTGGSVLSNTLLSDNITNDDNVSISAYPNPFTDNLTLKLSLAQGVGKFTIQVTDIAGRPVYRQEVLNATAGEWIQSLQLGGKLNSGIYFIQVAGLPGEAIRTLKVVKH